MMTLGSLAKNLDVFGNFLPKKPENKLKAFPHITIPLQKVMLFWEPWEPSDS
jgi:hypothetical protein